MKTVKSVKTEQVPVSINILDKEFRVACSPEEQEGLLRSARYLNERMREVRDTGKVIGIDRISVMTGLNIAHELLQDKARVEDFDKTTAPRLLALQQRIEKFLSRHRNRKIDF